MGRIQNPAVLTGVLSGVIANLIWGLAFVIPVILPASEGVELALGRYLFFGVISLCIVIFTRGAGIRGLDRKVWLTALAFAFAGHLGYYFFLVEGVNHVGSPVTTVIIGTLPVTVAVSGNLIRREFPFSRLLLPLAAIAAGLVLVNLAEFDWRDIGHGHSGLTWVIGIGSALVALILWTCYAVANSRFLRNHPEISSYNWSTLMGVGTLALSLIAVPVAGVSGGIHIKASTIVPLLIGCLVLGVLVSWVGTVLWNRSSGLVPISIAGQLTVVEIIAGLIYVFAWNRRIPSPMEIAGIVLLIGGVLLAIQRTRSSPAAEVEAEAQLASEAKLTS
jgi:drug/metabolite transporter (DMT)-like permease